MLRPFSILMMIFITCTLLAQANNNPDIKPGERVYIQTDKPYYASGDTIWFSAYLFNELKGGPSNISKVVRVELLTPEDSLLVLKKVYVDQLKGAGEIAIDRNLPAGKYLLRAYTTFMRNASDAYFYYQELPILAVESKENLGGLLGESNFLQSINPEYTGRPRIEYFHEGNVYISGVENNLVLKITDDQGNGLALSGKIVNSKNESIAVFNTYDFGLGSALFTPEKGEEYTILFNVGGTEHVFPINSKLEEGYNIRLTNRGSKLLLNIAASPGNSLENKSIIGYGNGKMIFQKTFTKDEKQSFSSRLLTGELSEGILDFYFYEDIKNPLIRRKTFVHKMTSDEDLIALEIEKESYKTRSPIRMYLSNLSPEDTIINNLTVSITDMASIDEEFSLENLKSAYLLMNQLEYVDSRYFFSEDVPIQKKLFLMDIALIANQKKIAMPSSSEEKQLKFDPEIGIYISGVTSELNKEEKPKHCNLTIDIIGTNFFHDDKETTKRGKFKLGPYFFEDSLDVVIQAREYNKDKYNKKGELKGSNRVSIWLDDTTTEIPAVNRPTFTRYKKSDASTLENYINQRAQKNQYEKQFLDLLAIEMDEVTIKGRRREKETEEEKAIKEATSLYTRPSNRVMMDDEWGMAGNTVFDLLRRVPGVAVSGNFPSQTVVIRGASSLTLSNAPLYLIDNVPVDADAVSFLNIQDVWFVDVLKGPAAAIYGSRGATGVILVYTRRGNGQYGGVKREPGIANFILKGYNKAKKFSLPDYRIPPKVISPDLRSTLYWDANLQVKGGERIPINLSSCDNEGDYLVKVSGIDNLGRPVEISKILRVRK